MPSFRDNLSLANALRVVLLTGRASTELRSADTTADAGTGSVDAPRLALVTTGAFRTPRGNKS